MRCRFPYKLSTFKQDITEKDVSKIYLAVRLGTILKVLLAKKTARSL